MLIVLPDRRTQSNAEDFRQQWVVEIWVLWRRKNSSVVEHNVVQLANHRDSARGEATRSTYPRMINCAARKRAKAKACCRRGLYPPVYRLALLLSCAAVFYSVLDGYGAVQHRIITLLQIPGNTYLAPGTTAVLHYLYRNKYLNLNSSN